MRITLQKLMLVLALAIGQAPIVWAAASVAAPGSITVQSSGITYYAQAGDTLMSIAQRLTTKTGNWVALGTINRINKDSNILSAPALSSRPNCWRTNRQMRLS